MRRDLELFVLGALPAAQQAEVAAHLARCPLCREAEAACRLLVGQVRLGADSAAPGPWFEQVVQAAVAAEIGAQRRRRRVRRVVAVAGLAAVLVMGLAVWRVWRGGGGTGPGAAKRPWSVAAADARVAAERWRYASAPTAPASAAERVVVAGTTMYLLRGDAAGSRVAAIDTATGAPRWRSECQTRGYLAADGTRVYCLAASGRRRLELVALGAADGRVLWRYQARSPHGLAGPCRPVPLSGDRVCWTAGTTLHLIDARSGEGIWSRAIAGEGPLSCAVAHGGRLAVVTSKALHCLEAATGREAWRKGLEATAPGCGRPLLALAGNRLYVAQARVGQGVRLSCVDLGAREVAWRRRVPGARCLLAVGDGVYLRGQRILALDGRTGKPMWRCAAEGCGPLTVVDGLLHFVDSSGRGRLVALHPHTGQTAWEIAGIRSCDAFAKVGRTGYIRTRDGIVHALAFRPGGPS